MHPVSSLRRDARISARTRPGSSARPWGARLLHWAVVLIPLGWGVYETLKDVAKF